MTAKKPSLLWRLEAAGLPEPSFLFGTMHVRDRRAFTLLHEARECVLACEAFATEFNLEEAGGGLSPDSINLPPGMTLDQLLGSRRYEKLRRILYRSAGIDIGLLRDKLPIIIANLVDERMLSRDMPYALDEMLWHYARQQGKIMLGIETYAEQLAILKQIPLSYQVQALLSLGRHIGRHRRHLLHLTHLYETGDIRRLYQAARRGTQGLRKLMLYQRNEIMADRIARLIRTQTTVCAVGAGHLAGGKGVLRLLKQRGIRVRKEPPSIPPKEGRGTPLDPPAGRKRE